MSKPPKKGERFLAIFKHCDYVVYNDKLLIDINRKEFSAHLFCVDTCCQNPVLDLVSYFFREGKQKFELQDKNKTLQV